MLYAIAAAAIAFTAPGLAPTAPARATPAVMAERKGAFWQRPDWIEMQEKAAAESAAATALSNVLSVPAACKFMEANPSVSFEEKKAFLLEKGVPEFTIAQAACTAPDTTLVL